MNPAQEKAYLAARPAAVAGATGPIEIHGNPGWKWSIRGSNFGIDGSLTIAGMAVKTSRWDNENIRGNELPIGIKGEIVVTPSRGRMTKAASGGNPAEYAPAPPVRKGVYDEDARRAAANKAMVVEAASNDAKDAQRLAMAMAALKGHDTISTVPVKA